MKQFSKLSLAEWNRLREQSLSPDQAAAYLFEKMPYRSFAEVLTAVYPEQDLRARLTDILTETGLSRESSDRTVRNWLKGASTPRDRETVYRVAFGLGLDVEKTNRLLCAVSDYGIHARDPSEVVYLFSLLTGESFADAQRLREECETLLKPGQSAPAATRRMQQEVETLTSEAAFLQWYALHADDFSQLHDTAYGVFKRMLDYLMGDQDDFSIEYLCNTCLRFRNSVPSDRERSHMDHLQRMIKHYWPNATAIKQMKERHIDVTRKALLLLYVLCEGESDEDQYTELDEASLTPKEWMEKHVTILDSILETCGMGTLDPRGAFDWMLMYCLLLREDEGMSERMEQVVACVFHLETDSTMV